MLCLNDALDSLTTGKMKNWVGADVYMVPQSDPNCSAQDSGDEDNPTISNLSNNQLLAECELRLIPGQDDEVVIVGDKEGLATLSTNAKKPKWNNQLNKWPEISDGSEQPNNLGILINKFEPPTNFFLPTLGGAKPKLET